MTLGQEKPDRGAQIRNRACPELVEGEHETRNKKRVGFAGMNKMSKFTNV
jgi:hypothetical protein